MKRYCPRVLVCVRRLREEAVRPEERNAVENVPTDQPRYPEDRDSVAEQVSVMRTTDFFSSEPIDGSSPPVHPVYLYFQSRFGSWRLPLSASKITYARRAAVTHTHTHGVMGAHAYTKSVNSKNMPALRGVSTTPPHNSTWAACAISVGF